MDLDGERQARLTGLDRQLVLESYSPLLALRMSILDSGDPLVLHSALVVKIRHQAQISVWMFPTALPFFLQ